MSNIDEEFIEFMSGIGGSYGFDPLSGRIFGMLYLEKKEMSMEEISKKIGYSAASVCNSLKTIEKSGFLKTVHVPKTKKLFFSIEKDFSRHIKRMVEMMRQSKIEPAKKKLPGIISRYKENKSKESHEKMALVHNYYKEILKLEKIVDYMEKQI